MLLVLLEVGDLQKAEYLPKDGVMRIMRVAKMYIHVYMLFEKKKWIFMKIC